MELEWVIEGKYKWRNPRRSKYGDHICSCPFEEYSGINRRSLSWERHHF